VFATARDRVAWDTRICVHHQDKRLRPRLLTAMCAVHQPHRPALQLPVWYLADNVLWAARPRVRETCLRRASQSLPSSAHCVGAAEGCARSATQPGVSGCLYWLTFVLSLLLNRSTSTPVDFALSFFLLNVFYFFSAGWEGAGVGVGAVTVRGCLACQGGAAGHTALVEVNLTRFPRFACCSLPSENWCCTPTACPARCRRSVGLFWTPAQT
jgi:hypothetical protein